jgi:tetratricopeptide (TPR) repeat protein
MAKNSSSRRTRLAEDEGVLMLWDPITLDVLPKNRAFVDLARKASTLRPDIVKNWERLAQRLLGAGEYEEAITVLAKAASRFPTELRLHLMLADAYYQAQLFNLAHEVLDRVAAAPIDDRETTIYRLELLMMTKDVQDAGQVATETLALDPTNIAALRVLGKASRKNGNPEIMIPICQAALKREPGHNQARYELAFALTILGRSQEAQRLIDVDRFITVTEIVTPQGYANAETFEAALAREITDNPTLRPDPLDRATRGGLQTMDGLPHAGERAVRDVIDEIRLAVNAFEANLPEGLDHPFIKARPKRAWLDAWAIVYPGHGRQVAHIHASGWLSGVYYVSAPKTPCDDVRNGCLVLGAMEMEGLSIVPPWGTREISPVPGRLVLFPSYVPHATIPTGSTDKRICIAFNVNPIRCR